MNPRRILCTALGLLLGLLFYAAYRTEQTLSNRLLVALYGYDGFALLKQAARELLVIPPLLRGCVPSALWCFITVSLCGGWTLHVRGHRGPAVAWLFLLLNTGWELVQALHWTDGRGDPLDVVAGSIGWMAGRNLQWRTTQPADLARLWSWRTAVVLAGFASMGFADVWR